MDVAARWRSLDVSFEVVYESDMSNFCCRAPAMFSIYFTFIHLTSLRFFTKANAFFSEMKFPVAFRRGALAVMSVLAVVVALAAPQAQAAPPTITSFTSSAVNIDSSTVLKIQGRDDVKVPVSLSADVTLSWELGGGTPTKLTLEYRDEKNKLINVEILPVTKTTHTLNLINHMYTVWLYAENSETPYRNSVGSSTKFEVRGPLLLLSTPGMPAKITDLTSSVDGSDVTLNWKVRSRYPRILRLVYKKDEDSVSRTKINNLKLSHTLTLQPGRYTFWLQYQNISSKIVRGTLSKGTTVTVRHADAPKIDSFTANLIGPIGDNQVKLDWVLSGGAPDNADADERPRWLQVEECHRHRRAHPHAPQLGSGPAHLQADRRERPRACGGLP